MPVLAARPRRLALACAMISVVALGTVSATAAMATGTTGTTETGSGSTGTPDPTTPEPPRGGEAFGLKYEPTDKAPDDVNEANDDFAACMRDEGQTRFPSFHAVKDDDGEIRLRTKLGGERGDRNRTDIGDFRKALEKCAPIMAKTGITFPDEDEFPGAPDHELPGPPDCGVLNRTDHAETRAS
ncbi:hypothetical protein ACFYXF_33530 [Streptomyces sp. NPDC002680]|uniref:hypothetical protein n=1 Tax=Streptomyces sp. NPDC002680 TaxID=3364659 RepID=UPI0036A16A8A